MNRVTYFSYLVVCDSNKALFKVSCIKKSGAYSWEKWKKIFNFGLIFNDIEFYERWFMLYQSLLFPPLPLFGSLLSFELGLLSVFYYFVFSPFSPFLPFLHPLHSSARRYRIAPITPKECQKGALSRMAIVGILQKTPWC